jgi:hypothetical protein
VVEQNDLKTGGSRKKKIATIDKLDEFFDDFIVVN